MGRDLRGHAARGGGGADCHPNALVGRRVDSERKRRVVDELRHRRHHRIVIDLGLRIVSDLGDDLELRVLPDHEPVVTGVVAPPSGESVQQFACFGGSCTVLVQGAGPAGSAPVAVEKVKRRLLEWHKQFSRFDPSSELSRLNRAPRDRVPVSPMMARFVEAVLLAAKMTGGLVDPTLVGELERAGYASDFDHDPFSAAAASRPAPRPAAPHPGAHWREVSVDRLAGTVTRPVGLRLDSGGVAKGLFGDVLGSLLAWHASYAVEASGDVRLGGSARLARRIDVASPFEPTSVLHSFELTDGAAATSGTTKRSWLGADGRVAHHLLDPSTGQPAFTGIAQATALAPSGVEAEALAKAALLSGPDGAAEWLPYGGVVVFDGGDYEVVESRPVGEQR